MATRAAHQASNQRAQYKVARTFWVERSAYIQEKRKSLQMIASRKPTLSVVFFIMVSVALAFGQGTYHQIDVPGSTATYCFGINKAGNISGSYKDVSGNWHGFLLSSGIYNTIDFPGSNNTQIYGLND